MTIGTVKFFNAEKGFGFVTPDGKGKDVFIPATSVTASGVTSLKAGQRISFEAKPDAKGPKAVDLKLLADAPAPKPVKPPVPAEAETRFRVYLDPSSQEADEVLSALRAAGHDPIVTDYIASPPSRDELRALSLLLQGSDQSLVRKYDPLFHGLRLDDRFISESEFWTGIVEHPSLINGPVVSSGSRARICRSDDDVRAFLENGAAAETPRKAKGVSERLAALIAGRDVPAKAPKKEDRPPKPADKPAKKPVAKAAPAVAVKAKPVAKKKSKAAPVKKAVPKPVKKAARAPKK